MHMVTSLTAHFQFLVSYPGPLPFPLAAFSVSGIKRTVSQSLFFLSKCFNFFKQIEPEDQSS